MVIKESSLGASKGWFIIVLVVFLSITGLDFVVNSVLYSYGLSFSYGWYIPYLVGISVTLLSICVLVVWQSYEDTRSVDVALKRGLTLFLAYFGGLVDCLYFLVYNGGDVYLGEWTWMWQYWLIGTWNWQLQTIWSFSFLMLIVGMWKVNIMFNFDRILSFLHIGRVRDRENRLM